MDRPDVLQLRDGVRKALERRTRTTTVQMTTNNPAGQEALSLLYFLHSRHHQACLRLTSLHWLTVALMKSSKHGTMFALPNCFL